MITNLDFSPPKIKIKMVEQQRTTELIKGNKENNKNEIKERLNLGTKANRCTGKVRHYTNLIIKGLLNFKTEAKDWSATLHL